ncbi:MAG: cation:proton antiporter [Desulfobacterales bacterium]|nr:cation:proton antiporter [Desulfobacterales bacterium]
MELESLQTIILALTFGTICYVLGKYLKVPAILFYLIAGIFAGPLGLDVIHPKALGHGLAVFVEIAVSIILFEGALSLPSQGFETSPVSIRRILLFSIPLTGIGSAIVIHSILGLSIKISIFFGAIIVVTGPTVIGPILKSMAVKHRLEILLRYEAIWGDCIGVLLSAVALKFLVMEEAISYKILITSSISQIILGIILGIGGGVLIGEIILPWVSKLGDRGLPGMVALSSALGMFWFSNHLVESSGPLAVAVSGFTISYLNQPYLKDIRHFKDQVAMLFISMLFVLLSAFINPFDFIDFIPKMILTAVILGVIIRPASIMLALIKTPVSFNERLFISFIGPRGIIAIAVASYASLTIKSQSLAIEMNIVLTTIFFVILMSGAFATIFSNIIARILKVSITEYESGIIFVGINPFSENIAKFALKHVPVQFIDTNPSKCAVINSKNISVICRSALDDDIYSEASETGFRRAIIMTPNDALNALIVNHARVFFGINSVFKSISSINDDSWKDNEGHLIHSIAFDNNFNFMEASKKISNGEAYLAIKDFSEALETDIPIFQIKEKGIKIVRAENIIDGKVLYFVEGKENT